jgi:predicted transcriptional regulator
MDTPESLFDQADEEAEAQADEAALADAEAGRVVSHAEVVIWLRSWGTEEELPIPQSRLRKE